MIDFNAFSQPNYVYLLVADPKGLTKSQVEHIADHPNTSYVCLTKGSVSLQSNEDLPVNFMIAEYQGDLLSTLNNVSYAFSEKEGIELINVSNDKTFFTEIHQAFPKAMETFQYTQRSVDYTNYANNGLMNSFVLNNPLIQFTAHYQGQQAIVLGAAPSLEQHLPWIKENQDKLVIFAVVRLAKRLYDEGIEVDFFVTIDPTDATIAHAKGIEKWQKKSVLIVQYYANHDMLDKWRGAVLYWGPEFPYQSQYFTQPTNVEMAEGTVANYGVLSALGLGCKSVFVTGMDLCFDGSGKTHESSSKEADIGQEFLAPKVVKNYSGEQANTTVEFYESVKAMEKQLITLKEQYQLPSDYTLVNLSEKAAKIAGINYQNYQAIELDEKPKHPVKNIIKECTLAAQEQPQMIKTKLAELSKQLKRYREIVKVCKQASKSIVNYSTSTVELDQTFQSFINKASKFEKKLLKLLPTQSTHAKIQHDGHDKYFKRYGFGSMQALIVLSNKLEQSPHNRVYLLDYFQEMFVVYEKIASKLIQAQQAAISEGQFLRDELNAGNDIIALAKLWLNAEKMNRFTGWEAMHKEAFECYSDTEKQVLSECRHKASVLAQQQLEEQEKTLQHFTENN